MNPEHQQVAIAEACGRVQRADGFWFPEGKYYGSQGIPNYVNDLNAMHEAEKVLTWKNQKDYAAALGRSYDGSFLHVTATAKQRAEAFLRTIGKWEEAK